MMSNDMNNKSNRGCDKQEELVTYLYGEATPEATKQFETHMRECLTCARELREFSSLRETMQTWEMDTLPHIVIQPKRTFAMVIRELFTVTPVWAKGLGAVAALLVFAALLNIEISVGNVKIGAHLFGKSVPAESAQSVKMEDIDKIIQQRVSESEQRNKQEMLMKLASLKEDLSRNHSEEIQEISNNLKKAQQQQIQRIVNHTIAINNLNFTELFNDLGSSEKDKDDNKNK